MLAAAAEVRELVPLSEADDEAIAPELDAMRKGRQRADAESHGSALAIESSEVMRDTKP